MRGDIPDMSAHAQSGARFAVHVTPRANRDGLIWGDPVRIRVTALPADGRATDAARKVLATALGVAPTRLRLLRGATSREKLFQLDD